MNVVSRGNAGAHRRHYSEEEVADIYRLGKLWLETGLHKRAEAIMQGLNEVAPDFAPAWLGTAFLRSTAGNYDGALVAAKTALKLVPDSTEAMLYIVAMSLTLGDVITAGTYLGEVGDTIEQGQAPNQNVVRFYRMQLARYETRSK